MNEEQMRKEFGRKFSCLPYSFDLTIQGDNSPWPGNYKEYHVQCAWEGYRVACANRQKDVDELLEALRLVNEELTDRMDDGDFCNPSLVRRLNIMKKILIRYSK